jgi:hypothetical protein
MLNFSLAFTLFALSISAAEFKSAKDCTTGLKVADRKSLTGQILSVEGSTCHVRLDSGETKTYLFWMLHPAGASAETDDQLTTGNYRCYAGSVIAGQLRITGPATYESNGKQGKYRIEPSRKIIFETGPYSEYTAKLLSGPKIGLNLNGGTFFGTTCSPAK